MKVLLNTLSKRERKAMLAKISQLYPGFNTYNLDSIEKAIVKDDSLNDIELIVLNKIPCFFKAYINSSEVYVPTLLCLQSLGASWVKGRLYVDRGAAIALSRGAHLMVPGIKGVEGDFEKGDIVACLYLETRAPVMVGIAELDNGELRMALTSKGKGRAVRRLHYIGDHIWKAASLVKSRLA